MGFIITFGFMVLDFASGTTKAFATHSFKSTNMRTGLIHKMALIIVVVLGVLLDYAQRYFDVGVTVPVTGAVCTYICLMEAASTIENVCKINPEILPEQLASMFGAVKLNNKNEGKETESNE
jgi:toxin secretion/phage lysis holin